MIESVCRGRDHGMQINREEQCKERIWRTTLDQSVPAGGGRELAFSFARMVVVVLALSSTFTNIANAGLFGWNEDEPQSFDEVIVWGYPDESAGWGPWASIGVDGRFTNIQLAPSDDQSLARFSVQTQDARCSSDPDISGSRGNQGEPERAARATKMYEAYRSQYGILPSGSRFPVIYGDGSSEVWHIAVSIPPPGGIAVRDPFNLMPPGSWAPPGSQCAIG